MNANPQNRIADESLSIVVLAGEHNPTILNPDFLKRNGIVPEDWGLAGDPICVPNLARVAFRSGIVIIAESERLTFTDARAGNLPDHTRLHEVASAYVRTLPHVAYRAVGVNPKAYLPLHGPDEAREFIVNRFVSKGAWLDIGDAPVRCAIKFAYTFGDCQCGLTVDEGTVPIDENKQPVIIFAGNFHRYLRSEGQNEKVEELCRVIEGWRSDYDRFRNIIVETLLQETRNAGNRDT